MESEPGALETLIKLLKENKELLTNGQALAQAMTENATFENHGVSVSFQKALLQTNIIESIAIADLTDDKSCDNAREQAIAELMPIMREDFAKKVVGILIGAVKEVKKEEKERDERKRKQAEEQKRKEEEEKRKAEEEKRKQEEQKRKAEEERRKQEEQKRKEEEEQKRKEEEERRKKKKSSSWAEVLVCIISLAIPIGALAIYRDMYPSQPSPKETAKTTNVTSTVTSNVTPKIDLNAVAKQPKQSSETSLDGIEIGMKATEMITLKGGANSQGEWLFPGYAIYDYGNLSAVVKDNKVCAIFTKAPAITTKKGVHTGSSAEEVKKAYGSTKASYFNNQLYEFSSIDNQKCYVGFEVSNNAVSNVRVAVKDVYDFFAAYSGLTNFHALITKKDFDSAYEAYLTENMRRQLGSYDSWKAGYRTTVKSEIKRVNSIKKVGNRVEIAYDLEATDNPGGTRYFTGRALIKNNGTFWAIDYMENR
ncbi:MAG: hypothetical protein IKN12_03810 [Selenomonadaceae bacterium]|nr:hypothetical protein [Selenomonadaceae bacterium]